MPSVSAPKDLPLQWRDHAWSVALALSKSKPAADIRLSETVVSSLAAALSVASLPPGRAPYEYMAIGEMLSKHAAEPGHHSIPNFTLIARRALRRLLASPVFWEPTEVRQKSGAPEACIGLALLERAIKNKWWGAVVVIAAASPPSFSVWTAAGLETPRALKPFFGARKGTALTLLLENPPRDAHLAIERQLHRRLAAMPADAPVDAEGTPAAAVARPKHFALASPSPHPDPLRLANGECAVCACARTFDGADIANLAGWKNTVLALPLERRWDVFVELTWLSGLDWSSRGSSSIAEEMARWWKPWLQGLPADGRLEAQLIDRAWAWPRGGQDPLINAARPAWRQVLASWGLEFPSAPAPAARAWLSDAVDLNYALGTAPATEAIRERLLGHAAVPGFWSAWTALDFKAIAQNQVAQKGVELALAATLAAGHVPSAEDLSGVHAAAVALSLPSALLARLASLSLDQGIPEGGTPRPRRF